MSKFPSHHQQCCGFVNLFEMLSISWRFDLKDADRPASCPADPEGGRVAEKQRGRLDRLQPGQDPVIEGESEFAEKRIEENKEAEKGEGEIFEQHSCQRWRRT